MISPAQVWSQALPFQQFHVLFNPLFKVLFIFRSLYLCAIGLWPIFSFRRDIPPILSSIPKLLDSSKELYRGSVSNYTGLSPSLASRSRELRRHLTKSILYKLQLGPKPDFKFELLPLHSPLLGQSLLVSFPPLIDMLKFSGYSYLIRGQPCVKDGAFTAGTRDTSLARYVTTTLGVIASPPLAFRAYGSRRTPTPSRA
jgi:hypothetical protein